MNFDIMVVRRGGEAKSGMHVSVKSLSNESWSKESLSNESLRNESVFLNNDGKQAFIVYFTMYRDDSTRASPCGPRPKERRMNAE